MDGSVKESARGTRRLGVSPLYSLCGLILLASLIACAGCGNPLTALFGGSPDSQIQDSTKAIETARNDGERAKAYSSRGSAYSEKARIGRLQKQMSDQEYERLFDLAVKDHDQAVALDPNNAEVYFNRAQAYYDRGSLDFVYAEKPWIVNPSTKAWLDAAATDFEKAAAMDPKNDVKFDRLGLAYEEAGEEDNAVRAYTQEMALNPFGKQRLADAYCMFGFRHSQEKEYAAAAAAYQKSLEFGVADDKSCPYEPLEMLAAFYTVQTHEYDKAWEMVHQAQKAGRRIGPEVMERLKKASGRTD